MTYQSKSQAKRIEVMKNAEQSDYENLSRKLEGLWHDSFKAPGYQALRAVVELHKQSGGGSNFCYACSFELEIPYPCPTIQAIAIELEAQ